MTIFSKLLGRSQQVSPQSPAQPDIDLLDPKALLDAGRIKNFNTCNWPSDALAGWDATGKDLDYVNFSGLDLRNVKNIARVASFDRPSFDTHSRLSKEQITALEAAEHFSACEHYLDARPWERPVERNAGDLRSQKAEFKSLKNWRTEKAASADAGQLARKLSGKKSSYLAQVNERTDAIITAGLDPSRVR